MRADAVALKSRCTRAICHRAYHSNQTILNEQTKATHAAIARRARFAPVAAETKTDYVPSSDDYCADSEALFATNENSVFSRPQPSESNLSTFPLYTESWTLLSYLE
jgi:hypothetical protein